VFFQEAAKMEQGRGIRHSRLPQIRPAELTEQGNVVQRLFTSIFSQVEPVRHAVHAQHLSSSIGNRPFPAFG
jgi:hypothetical protein